MTRLTIIWDDMQAVRECGVLKWVPVFGREFVAYVKSVGEEPTQFVGASLSGVISGDGPSRARKVTKCEHCGTMRPIGARYHAAMLRERDDLLCGHGNVYWSDCKGRIPPPCCWEGAS